MSSQRAIVTGSTGFIGTALVELLTRAGWRVVCPVRRRPERPAPGAEYVDWPNGAGNMIDLFHMTEPTVCFNLAGDLRADHTPADVDALLDANVRPAAMVGEAASTTDSCRVVHAATVLQHTDGPADRPHSLYAATKQAAEDVLGFYATARNLPVATVVVFSAYGKGEPSQRITSLLVDSALTGTPISASPGHQRLDLVHVDDIARALLTAATVPLDGPYVRYEARTGRLTSLRELADTIASLVGSAPNVDWGARPYRGGEMFTLWHAAGPLPGWGPEVSLEDGLASLVDSRRSRLGSVDPSLDRLGSAATSARGSDG